MMMMTEENKPSDTEFGKLAKILNYPLKDQNRNKNGFIYPTLGKFTLIQQNVQCKAKSIKNSAKSEF